MVHCMDTEGLTGLAQSCGHGEQVVLTAVFVLCSAAHSLQYPQKVLVEAYFM